MIARKACWAAMAVFVFSGVLLAEDANTTAEQISSAAEVVDLGDQDDKARVLVGLGKYPGPLGGYSIILQITNQSNEHIKKAIVNYKKCLGGAGIIIDDMWSASGPTATWTGLDTDKIVFRFTGFGPGQTFSIAQDPDTRDDPSYGIYVRDMADTKAKVKFDGVKKKGKGKFKVSGSDVIAKIKRKVVVE